MNDRAPTGGSTRKRHALELFGGLPRHYDRVAAVLSFGQDPRLRRTMVAAVDARPGERVLDVATGTGLVAQAVVRRYGRPPRNRRARYCLLREGMLGLWCALASCDERASPLGAREARSGREAVAPVPNPSTTPSGAKEKRAGWPGRRGVLGGRAVENLSARAQPVARTGLGWRTAAGAQSTCDNLHSVDLQIRQCPAGLHSQRISTSAGQCESGGARSPIRRPPPRRGHGRRCAYRTRPTAPWPFRP